MFILVLVMCADLEALEVVVKHELQRDKLSVQCRHSFWRGVKVEIGGSTPSPNNFDPPRPSKKLEFIQRNTTSWGRSSPIWDWLS